MAVTIPKKSVPLDDVLDIQKAALGQFLDIAESYLEPNRFQAFRRIVLDQSHRVYEPAYKVLLSPGESERTRDVTRQNHGRGDGAP